MTVSSLNIVTTLIVGAVGRPHAQAAVVHRQRRSPHVLDQ
jgi:hypothetical protein